MARIVIIGAGYAGWSVAKTLASSLRSSDATEVVLLEKSKFFYHAVGAPRAYVDAEYAAKMFIPYDNAIPQTEFVRRVRAVATGISASKKEVMYQVIGDDDQPATETKTMTFDFLVLAMGSSHTAPIKEAPANFSPEHTKQQLKQIRSQLVEAESILIVGGGGVGCEVAGEVATYFPNKKVTLLHSHERLCSSNGLTDKFHEYLMHSLEKLKVNVILGERLIERLTDNSFGRRTLMTHMGTAIESDVQLLCSGFNPLSELMRAMDESLVDDNGRVRVNASLQLDASKYPHIFALGDLNNHPAPKSAGSAYRQGEFVAKELMAFIRNKQHEVTRVFPCPSTQSITLSLGPNGGVSQLPVFGGIVFGDLLTRWVKSRDLHVGVIRWVFRAPANK
ncbi:hypothetical protein Poli38472_003474 [Pythium oligandrum]|uniref:FAD/NAD(P)-binding domain-containing protein n=1 Tax=Pythium oligandrum TaxID=41045 RepID=A0A8K1C6L1_PYTOL|nr:hypothetical protein Poli38472_003474 [Pythium oligandrum]|eukprot:TMW57549.1 hypothetical protein Poli38472_003474 [Pythium oligandrum]